MVKKLTFLVTLKVDKDTSVAEAAQHIRKSCEWMGGEYHPTILAKATVKSFHRNNGK